MVPGKMSPKVQALIDAARARTSANNSLPSSLSFQPIKELKVEDKPTKEIPTVIHIDKDGNEYNPYELDGLILNERQRLAVDLFGLQGKSGCLIGPAGTGKTTTMKAVIRASIMSGRIPILPEDLEHKYLNGGLPGIYGGSFTRIATRNLRDNCPADIKANIHTLHRLLEYEPEMVTVYDEVAKKDKNVRVFKPTRHSFRMLPEELKKYLLDESSMIGYSSLFANLRKAIDPAAKAEMLFIGDIAQLPPVMDDAVLGYKMLEYMLPEHNTLVELTEVYRHAGAIVNLANKVRTGNVLPTGMAVVPYSANPSKLPLKIIKEWFVGEGWTALEDNKFMLEEDGSKVTIQYWKTRLDGEVGQLRALQNLGLGFFPKQIESGDYIPEEHMILMPYNKAVGTLELNKYIAQYLGAKRKAEVYEVIAGYVKHYFAVGDKVFYDREEAIITKIAINGMYAGKVPVEHSITLNRWGHNTAGSNKTEEGYVDDIDALLNINIDGIGDDERKNQSSHVITVKKLGDEDAEADYKLSTASEINGLIFGYALTIHKSQGSQWKKVYCVFHNSHNRNLQRELLYTGITRAQKELFIICEPETLIQGVTSQHIVGNSLAEKAEYFKGKVVATKQRNDMFNKGEADGNG